MGPTFSFGAMGDQHEDPLRVGAVEQLGMYATVAGAPLEVLYKEADILDAMRRLASCDVVVVDTPDALLVVEIALQGDGPLDAVDATAGRFTLLAVLRVNARVPQARLDAGQGPLLAVRVHAQRHRRAGCQRR